MSGIANDLYEGVIPGLRRIVSTEIMIPKKRAPASPIYIFAGERFQ